MRHDLLHLLLDVPEQDLLLAWAAAPFKPLAGQVIFYSDAQARLPHESISFEAGQCVSYSETFDDGTGGGGTGAYVCALTITAPAFALHVGGGPATAAAPAAIAAALTRLSPAAGPTPGLVATPGPGAAWLDDLETLMGPAADVRTHVATWVAGGLSEKKLASALNSGVGKRLIFERLRDVKKGVFQQRVVIDDYDNIPGVDKKPCLPNGLPPIAIPASNFGVNDPAFDLPLRNAPTFTDCVSLGEVKPGEKLFRVTSDPANDAFARTGGYWTRTLPANLAEVIGGTAVMPEWNNFQRVYEFTAPPYTDAVAKEPKFYVWEGPTAAQPVSGEYQDKIDNGYSLAGGAPQVFVPNKLSRDPDFGNHIKDVTHLHKSW